MGLVDHWLRHVSDIYEKHQTKLDSIPSFDTRARVMCELNVVEQVRNVCETTVLQNAWGRGQPVAVHGWIYDVADGLLKDLDICIEKNEELPIYYATALASVSK
jgi:carbonic anhydrase